MAVPHTKILEGDALFNLIQWINILGYNKWMRLSSLLAFSFLCFEYITAVPEIITSHGKLFLSKYSAVGAGSLITFVSYVTLYYQQSDYTSLYFEIFPTLWNLHYTGEENFKKFKRIAKYAKYYTIIALVTSLATAFAALPWYGDEEEIYYPIHFFKQHFKGWTYYLFATMLYASFFHMAPMIIANGIVVMYLVLHLNNQCFLLHKKLKNLTNDSIEMDPCAAVKDEIYQIVVTRELTLCIQQHQRLIDFGNRINDLIYYPIFFFTIIGVFVGVSVILLPAPGNTIIRTTFAGLTGFLLTVGFSIFGQLLENESENIFLALTNLPWYLWNVKNRKLVQIFMHKSQDNFSLSASGIVTINSQLLIRMYKSIYSVITFLMNFSKQRT